jgi:putative transposase
MGAMFPKRPRIAGFSYIGFHRYSLTICTSERKPLFSDAETVDAVLTTIRRSAEAHGFAVLAYCFMPDHVHLIVGASSESADLQKFVTNWKQLSGFAHKQRTRESLWQPSYFDHVLRDEEETSRAVRYVLENPVRKRMVAEFSEYKFSGSDVFGVDELREYWQG